MIELEGVGKRFGDQQAIDGLTFSVHEGAVFALVGPAGAGKTTAVRILATLVRADEGTATVAGLRVDRDPAAVRRSVGYLPQQFGGYQRTTGREHLEFYAAIHDVPLARRRRLADELLEVLGLADRGGDDVETYGKAERTRLGLARTLVHDPAVLLLDEPMAGLDAGDGEDVAELVRELGSMGKTVLVTARLIDDAERMAGELGVLDAGRLTAAGSPAEVRERLAVAGAVATTS